MNERWVSEQLKTRNEIMSLQTFYVKKAGFPTEQNIILDHLLYFEFPWWYKTKYRLFSYIPVFFQNVL